MVDIGMPAGNQKTKAGEGKVTIKPGGEKMGVQMVDTEEWYADTKRQALRKGHTDQKAAEKTGAARNGNEIYLANPLAGACHELVKERGCKAIMLARSQLGNNAAEKGMNGHLTRKDMIKQMSVFHKSEGGFVTRTFNS